MEKAGVIDDVARHGLASYFGVAVEYVTDEFLSEFQMYLRNDPADFGMFCGEEFDVMEFCDLGPDMMSEKHHLVALEIIHKLSRPN